MRSNVGCGGFEVTLVRCHLGLCLWWLVLRILKWEILDPVGFVHLQSTHHVSVGMDLHVAHHFVLGVGAR